MHWNVCVCWMEFVFVHMYLNDVCAFASFFFWSHIIFNSHSSLLRFMYSLLHIYFSLRSSFSSVLRLWNGCCCCCYRRSFVRYSYSCEWQVVFWWYQKMRLRFSMRDCEQKKKTNNKTNIQKMWSRHKLKTT